MGKSTPLRCEHRAANEQKIPVAISEGGYECP